MQIRAKEFCLSTAMQKTTTNRLAMEKNTLAASSGFPMRLVARLRVTAPASPIDRLIRAAVVDSPRISV